MTCPPVQERATPEACADFNERYGFNDPIIAQFVHYAGDVFTATWATRSACASP